MLSIEEPTEKQRNTALCFPGLGVARLIFPFAFRQRHWQLIAYQLAPCTGTYIMHACTHMTNPYLCFLSPPLIKSHMHTTKSPIHRCMRRTHRLLLRVSQLCSDIKQSPLRENKHADEERLAGHRGRQHTHTNTDKRGHINAYKGSGQR